MKAYRGPKPEQPRPTTERLARALEAAQAPLAMIEQARRGAYDDFKSRDSATPIIALVHDCRAAGLWDVARRAMAGEFDATPAEAEAWAQSPEGREVLRQLREGR